MTLRRLVQLLLVTYAGSLTAQTQDAVRGYLSDSSLAFLAPLMGTWRPLHIPDSLLRLQPPIVALDYSWTVGRKAVQLRESYRGNADSSLMAGLVYWNPATERVEWVAVAGKGDGEGRLFIGEYRYVDGVIERVYDAFYRAAPDVPGDRFGGLRRRYRETYRVVTADSIVSTLDWFHDGAWRPFGQFARGAFRRISER